MGIMYNDSNECLVSGKWNTLKCGNRSTEMEVQKPKYGSEKNSPYQCLVHYWLANVCRSAV